jgi:hypothetical protein
LVETLLPILYLKGVSTGYRSDGWALLGRDATGLSGKYDWELDDDRQDDHALWRMRPFDEA